MYGRTGPYVSAVRFVGLGLSSLGLFGPLDDAYRRRSYYHVNIRVVQVIVHSRSFSGYSGLHLVEIRIPGSYPHDNKNFKHSRGV